MNRDQLIKLLHAMYNNSSELRRMFKEDRKYAMARSYQGEMGAYYSMIQLLTNPDYARKIWNIYCPREVLE